MRISFLSLTAVISISFAVLSGVLGGEREFLRQLDEKLSRGLVVEARKDVEERKDMNLRAMLIGGPILIIAPVVLWYLTVVAVQKHWLAKGSPTPPP